MTKIFPRMVILCFTLGIFSSVHADNLIVMDYDHPVSYEQKWYEEYRYPHLYAFAAGPVFSSDAGESQKFPIMNPDTDAFYNYKKNNQIQTHGQFAFFIGDRWDVSYPFQIEGGVAYSQTGQFSTSGQLTQGADIQSEDTYSYHYKIQSRQLEAKAKLLYACSGSIFPYLSFGMGAAFNTASDFSTNVPPFLTTTRSYPSGTQTSFTYTVGLGAEYEYNSHIHLGLGYEFSNNGTVAFESSNISGIPVNGTITQSHLYTHAVMAQVSYFFDNYYNFTLKKLTDWN